MIIIFKDNLTTAAVLDVVSATLDVRDPSVGDRLLPYLNELASGRPAHLKIVTHEDDVRRIGFEDITRNNPRFEEAMAFELGTRGLHAISVDTSLRPLFERIEGLQFTTDQRRQIIALVRNLPADKAQEGMTALIEIAELGGQLDETRRQWDATVQGILKP